MTKPGKFEFGVELITFYHPGYWGEADRPGVLRLFNEKPEWFWTRILDGVAEAGATGIELTFGPFSWSGATKAFGSVDGFAKAMAQRGLRVASAYFLDIEAGHDIVDPASRKALFEEVDRHADFLAAVGAKTLVVGMPMRISWDSNPPLFVDFPTAQRYAEVLNELGARTLNRGIKAAIHTEAHSFLATGRDVDLFMLLTDPVYVGLCPDAAHLVVAGCDPVALMQRHIDRVAIAHWKDAIGPMPIDTKIDATIHQRHQPYFTRLGAGRVDWNAWTRIYRDHPLDRWALLELDASPSPVADIIASRQFVETALSPILGPEQELCRILR